MPAPTNATAAAKPAPTTTPPLPKAPLALALAEAIPFARFMIATNGMPKVPSSPANATAVTNVTTAPTHSPHRHHERDDEKDVDPLDPATRRLAQLAPPHARFDAPAPAAPTAHVAEGEVARRARVSIEELLPQLVRRIAWAGDRRRGSVQLELGAGRHAGTVVTVHADDGRVRVDVQGSEELRARISERLARHGLDVES